MDLYSTNSLIATLEDLRSPGRFLLDAFFPDITVDDSEEIHFDKLGKNLKLAPFVAPMAKATGSDIQGYQTDTFKPAYLKPMRSLRPATTIKRRAGESLGGALTPLQRRMNTVTQGFMECEEEIVRRLEWMASSALLTGTVTVSGPDYASQVVNFDRSPNLTKTLTGNDRWGQSEGTPIDDLQDWITEASAIGAAPNIVVMDAKAWALFRKDPDFKDMISTEFRGGSAAAELGFIPGVPGSPVWGGVFGQVEIYVYNDVYEDDDGNVQNLLPDYTVIMGATAALSGIQAYGAILDEEALQAMERFPKSWVEPNPSVRFLMVQSAPLVVPGRPDATMAVTVA